MKELYDMYIARAWIARAMYTQYVRVYAIFNGMGSEKQSTKWRSFLLYILAGVLIGTSFVATPLWWCAFVGCGVFFLALELKQSIRFVVVGSLITGFIKAGMSAVWLFDAYPADWLGGATRMQQLIVIGGCWFGTAFSIALGYVLIGVLIRRVQSVGVWGHSVLYAATFVLGEIVGSIFFSLYTYGTGGSVNAFFGFSKIGFTLSEHGLLKYLAVIAGVYGLSFVLALLASLAVRCIQKEKTIRKKVAVSIILTLIYVLSGFISWTPDRQTTTTVAAVATRFPSYASLSEHELASRQRELVSGIHTALRANAQVVVLPEDARYGYDKDTNLLLESLALTPHVQDAVVVDSYRTNLSPSAVVIRGYIYDIDNKRVYTTDKQYVVPMGEYLPYLHSKIVGFLDGALFFDAMRYVQGIHELSATTPAHIPHILFCFESGASAIAKTKAVNRASLLMAHPVSHGWFHTPHTLWNQERQMLIVQALYSRTPILQAGNNAPSKLYTTYGEVIEGTVIEDIGRHTTLLFTF